MIRESKKEKKEETHQMEPATHAEAISVNGRGKILPKPISLTHGWPTAIALVQKPIPVEFAKKDPLNLQKRSLSHLLS